MTSEGFFAVAVLDRTKVVSVRTKTVSGRTVMNQPDFARSMAFEMSNYVAVLDRIWQDLQYLAGLKHNLARLW